MNEIYNDMQDRYIEATKELGRVTKERDALQWYMDTDPCLKALESIAEGGPCTGEDAQDYVDLARHTLMEIRGKL